MRTRCLFLAVAMSGATYAAAAGAQVTDASRAAARELFRQGDELQRESRFAEALDKFQRAQQVFAAPTNLLRIAECDAALGRLVESAEAYRAVIRTPLTGASTPAFQAAVEQARAELEQVAPRVPRLIVEVQAPAGLASLELRIDGQSVPAALIGEAIPLDPGVHKVLVSAPGFAAPEQQVDLKEQQTKKASFTLSPAPSAPAGPVSAAVPPPTASPALPPATGPAAAGVAPATPGAQPGADVALAPKRSRTSVLLGAHLGLEIPSGKLPVAENVTGPIDIRTFGSTGLALGLDGGLRFARQWVAGLTLERAQMGSTNPSKTIMGVTEASSNTTLLAATLGLIVNPERPSLYAEFGLGVRWYNYSESHTPEPGYTSGELSLGAGLWVPLAGALRLLPKVTAGFGAFNQSGSSGGTSGQTYGFVMVGAAAFYDTGN